MTKSINVKNVEDKLLPSSILLSAETKSVDHMANVIGRESNN